jgi:PadR family transcriptional regulator PadR
MPAKQDKTDLMQGTLDLLILRTLRAGAQHGYAIAHHIQETSDGFLQVEEGSLYPALHRMEKRGWIEAEWGLSDSRRKAKFYSLTTAGRAQLKTKTKTWQSLVGAIASVLKSPATEA